MVRAFSSRKGKDEFSPSWQTYEEEEGITQESAIVSIKGTIPTLAPTPTMLTK